MNIIECSGMGAHENWYQNHVRSNKIGAEFRCQHCQKAMAADNGWEALYGVDRDAIWPLDTTDLTGLQWVRLGNECVKHFADATTKSTHFRRITPNR